MATSCSIGVKRKKLSRLNSVTGNVIAAPQQFLQLQRRIYSAEAAAENQYAAGLGTDQTVFRTAIFHGLNLANLLINLGSPVLGCRLDPVGFNRLEGTLDPGALIPPVR